jgi:HPt (histidine-containing phosphotransfer) domain-containing protein
MPRWLAFAFIVSLFAAYPAAAQSRDSSVLLPQRALQDSAPPAETKKPKKVWTNEDISHTSGAVSVVGDPKNKPKPETSKPANAQYVASVQKQLDKLQGQIGDIDKQLVDLKNFSAGEPSTTASGIKLDKSYQREPIEVQMRALQDKKKDLETKLDALLDEARKKGVDSSQLR